MTLRIVLSSINPHEIGVKEDGSMWFKSHDGRFFNVIHAKKDRGYETMIHEVILEGANE